MEQWWLLFETEFDALSYDLQRYLFDSFRNFAYREVFFLLKDHSLTEDVIQESFLKITSKRQQLKNATSRKQWMKRIVRNTALDILKKSKKYRDIVDLENVINRDTDMFNFEVAARWLTP